MENDRKAFTRLLLGCTTVSLAGNVAYAVERGAVTPVSIALAAVAPILLPVGVHYIPKAARVRRGARFVVTVAVIVGKIASVTLGAFFTGNGVLAVVDLDAGPVTVTLPDPGARFMSLLVINEDHYAPDVYYAPGKFTISKESAGTRYVALAVRTFVDPNSPADVEKVHALQDAIKVEQKALGEFEAPSWDATSQDKVRAALINLAAANGGQIGLSWASPWFQSTPR